MFRQPSFFAVEELEDLLFDIKPYSFILDIGANVGNHTVFFAQHLHAKNVVPFEVNPAAVKMLRMNIEINHLPNVDLSYIGMGISSQKGELFLAKSIKNNLSATSFSTSRHLNTGRIRLDVDVLDNILPSNTQVDFIKIDVEGMEFEVLDGGKKFIQECRPIIFLECWGWVASLRLLSWLVENNYRIEKKFGPSYLVLPLAADEYYPKAYLDDLSGTKMRSYTEIGNTLAIERLTKLSEKYLINPHISYAFAEILLKLDQTEAAWKAMRDIEDKTDYQVVAWYQTIFELSQLRGQHDSELDALHKAARLSPHSCQIVEQLYKVYKASGNEKSAYIMITDFLAANPEYAKGHYIKSTLSERMGLMDEALVHARLAAKLDSPDKPSFMVRLADLTPVVERSPSHALDIINEAIRLGQTSDWAYYIKITILDALDRRFDSMLLRAYCKTRAILRNIKRKLNPDRGE